METKGYMPDWRANAERYMSPGEKKVHLEAHLDGLIDVKKQEWADFSDTKKKTIESTIKRNLEQLDAIDRPKAIAIGYKNKDVELFLSKTRNQNPILEPKVDVKPSNPLEYTKTSRYNNIFMVFTSLNLFSYIRSIVKTLIPFLRLVVPLYIILIFDMSWFLELYTELFGKIYEYLPKQYIEGFCIVIVFLIKFILIIRKANKSVGMYDKYFNFIKENLSIVVCSIILLLIVGLILYCIC